MAGCGARSAAFNQPPEGKTMAYEYDYEMITPKGDVLRGTVRASNWYMAEMAVYRATGTTAQEMFLCRDGATMHWAW